MDRHSAGISRVIRSCAAFFFERRGALIHTQRRKLAVAIITSGCSGDVRKKCDLVKKQQPKKIASASDCYLLTAHIKIIIGTGEAILTAIGAPPWARWLPLGGMQ